MDSVLQKDYKGPTPTIEYLSGIHDHVFVLHDVLTEAECDEIIFEAEDAGFKIAGFYTDEASEATYVDTEKRRSKRCSLEWVIWVSPFKDIVI
jgi:hypothetical protein